MHSEDCDKSLMSVFHFGKSAAVSVFVCSSSAFFVCVRHNLLDYLAFRTTKVKDAKLTLAVVFEFFIALQTYEKKVAEFPFL